MNRICGTCGKAADCRPYGAGGALICFPCMKASPEREQEAKRQLGRRFDAAGPVAILTDDGPAPLTAESMQKRP